MRYILVSNTTAKETIETPNTSSQCCLVLQYLDIFSQYYLRHWPIQHGIISSNNLFRPCTCWLNKQEMIWQCLTRVMHFWEIFQWTSYTLPLLIYLFLSVVIARQQSCQDGNVLRRTCQSVCSGMWSQYDQCLWCYWPVKGHMGNTRRHFQTWSLWIPPVPVFHMVIPEPVETLSLFAQTSFSHTHRNANIGIFVFTAWKQKKSSDKMLPRVGIEPRQQFDMCCLGDR